MSAIRFALFAGSLAGLFAVSHPALGAADSAALCADVAGPKAMVAEHHSRWIDLSAEQWQFLRRVYAMNPETPPNLSYGDHAALARFDDMGSGIVFFIDGDRACTPTSASDAESSAAARRGSCRAATGYAFGKRHELRAIYSISPRWTPMSCNSWSESCVSSLIVSR